MKRGYNVRQVRESLEALSRSGLPFGASLMFGAPGETPETIAETLAVMDDYAIPNGVWVTHRPVSVDRVPGHRRGDSSKRVAEGSPVAVRRHRLPAPGNLQR